MHAAASLVLTLLLGVVVAQELHSLGWGFNEMRPSPGISEAQKARIQQAINAHLKTTLNQSSHIRSKAKRFTSSFTAPLRAPAALLAEQPGGFHYISAYADHNSASGASKDYSCGTRSRDNHAGTDFVLAPFPFYFLASSSPTYQVEVIAVQPGQVVYTQTAFADNHCACINTDANVVAVLHSDGSAALYGHFKKNSIVVSVGSTVARGQKLGIVGSSGCSTGPHLHLEVYSDWNVQGSSIDPFLGPCNPNMTYQWWNKQPQDPKQPSILTIATMTVSPTFDFCCTSGLATCTEAHAYDTLLSSGLCFKIVI